MHRDRVVGHASTQKTQTKGKTRKTKFVDEGCHEAKLGPSVTRTSELKKASVPVPTHRVSQNTASKFRNTPVSPKMHARGPCSFNTSLAMVMQRSERIAFGSVFVNAEPNVR